VPNDAARERVVASRGLRFAYGNGAPVLDGVDLDVRQGERVALVGANGAGKTTLLRILAGALAPQAGTVQWEGQPLGSLGRRALARLVAVVPQQVPSGPLEDMTVEDVASLGRTPYAGWLGLRGETDADRAAVAEALGAVDADGLAARPLSQLSGGERQRAFLSMALAQQPRLLLLDEPTRHLDPHHQVALLELLRALAATRGLTVLAVLHDLNLAAWFFPRLVLLHAGHIVADGPPGDVLTAANVARAYGSGLDVIPHPRCPDIPLVTPVGTP